MRIQTISANFNTKTFFTKPSSINFCSSESVLFQPNSDAFIHANNLKTWLVPKVNPEDKTAELEFKKEWIKITDELGIDKETSEQKFEQIIRINSENNRQYHKINHVLDSLKQFELYCADNPEKLTDEEKVIFKLGIVFHNMGDERLSTKSAEESAELAENFLEHAKKKYKSRKSLLRDLILSTKHGDNNFKPHHENEELCKLMKDINYSILGRPFVIYKKHVNQLKNEWIFAYGKEEVDNFYEKRRASLQNLVKKENIFSTEWFRNKDEIPAKINIINELAAFLPKEEFIKVLGEVENILPAEEFIKIQRGIKGILPKAMKL